MDTTVLNLEIICKDPFWNSSLTLNSDWPQFTHCFQYTALSWPPMFLLLLSCPGWLLSFRLGSLESRSNQTHHHLSFLSCLRLIGVTSLAALSLVLLLKDVMDKDDLKSSYVVLISHSLHLFTFICVIVMLTYERYKGVVASGVMFIFWSILVIAQSLFLCQRIMHEHYETDETDFIMTTMIYCLIVLQFFLCFFPDSSRQKKTEKSKKPWPEKKTSFPGKIFFAWLFSTIYTAWRRSLTEEDIFDLPESVKGDNTIPKFDAAWAKVTVPKDQLSQNTRTKKETEGARNQIETTPARYATNSFIINRQYSSKREDENSKGGTAVISNGNDVSKATANGNSQKNRQNGAASEGSSHQSTRNTSDGNDTVKQNKKKLPFSLLKALLKVHGLNYSFGFLLKMTGDCFQILTPLILREIIKFVQESGVKPMWIGISWCFALFLCQMIKSLSFNASIYLSSKIGLKMKSSLMAAIFQKAMTMSSEARKKYTAGEIITLMSVDAQRIQEVWRITVMLAGSPIQLIGSTVLLYYTVGISVVSGLAVLLLLLPLNSLLASQMRKYQALNMKLKDRRVKLITDVMNGIRVLKLYAWEISFADKIAEIRQLEMSNLRRLSYYRTAMSVNNWMTPYLVTLATFATYVMVSEDNHLDPATAFVSLTYFSIMRSPLIIITYVIAGIVMSTVSLKRINEFLYCEDLDPECVGSEPKQNSAVTIVDGSFAWDKEDSPTVSNVTLDVPEKALTMIVGRVGSGKSSLLSGILGEMTLCSGSVDVKGSVAYVAQQAWIQNATVKENILFGSPLDHNKYKSVIKACALERDLTILPKGGETEIGEKGVNLSGGQKQRVALARAVYSDQDLYMMDDPLSAVDAHVGKHIFDQVLGPEGLLKDKTRILVTHGAHWLPHADTVVMLQDGQISHTGTFGDLLAQEGDFVQLLKQPEKEEEADGEETGEETEDDDDDDDDEIYVEDEDSALPFPDHDVVVDDQDKTATNFGMEYEKSAIPLQRMSTRRSKRSSKKSRKGKKKKAMEQQKKDMGKIIEDEKMQQGKVKVKVLLTWIRAGSILGVVITFSLQAMFHGVNATGSFWLKFWTQDSYLANTSLSNTTKYEDTNNMYLGVYGGFGGVAMILFSIGYATFWMCAVRAASKLHRGMLNSILKSPMEFFDTTPVGRILNRFSSDVDTMDLNLPLVFVDIFNCMAQILATIVVVCVNVPLFTSVILPIFVIFYILMMFYIPTARQLKRMDTVSKSPIYSHFSEAVSGASTVRAFGHTNRFMEESRQKVDYSTVRSLMLYACSSWLSLSVDSLGMIFVFAAAMFAVTSSGVGGADTGLAVSYSIEFSMFLGFLVRQQTELTAHSVSVERILEYSELKAEGLERNRSLPPQWVSEGQIVFKDFQLRYREGLDLVLRGINAEIKPGEKVGIVGRTGAGKSTVTLALFRIIEAAGGSICIDGIDIADVDLTLLRSRISILPQDPVLFSGSLRMNLDPHDDYKDEDIMRALESAHLKEFVKGIAGGLSFDVGEEGKNMSVGQRQLVCLARALLRQNKILVLDEATAAVDVQTDSFIQETIRSVFKDCTVLTIAHRINTIMDYDRVMVLDAGEIKEFAPVKDLLNDPNGFFYSLAKEAKLV